MTPPRNFLGSLANFDPPRERVKLQFAGCAFQPPQRFRQPQGILARADYKSARDIGAHKSGAFPDRCQR